MSDRNDSKEKSIVTRREFVRSASGTGAVVVGTLVGLTAAEEAVAREKIVKKANDFLAQTPPAPVEAKAIAYGGTLTQELNRLFSRDNLFNNTGGPSQFLLDMRVRYGNELEGYDRNAFGKFTWDPDTGSGVVSDPKYWGRTDSNVSLKETWKDSSRGISDPAKDAFTFYIRDNLRRSNPTPKPMFFVVGNSGIPSTSDTARPGWNGYRVAYGIVSDNNSRVDYVMVAMLCPPDAVIPLKK